MNLADDLLDKGCVLAVDNWFSSPDLFRRLSRRKTNTVGTVRKNRAGMPNDFANVKLKKGETACRVSTDGLMTLVWRDKKDVRILSTFHRSDMVDIGKKNRNGTLSESRKVSLRTMKQWAVWIFQISCVPLIVQCASQ